jgi:hypothetical protein
LLACSFMLSLDSIPDVGQVLETRRAATLFIYRCSSISRDPRGAPSVSVGVAAEVDLELTLRAAPRNNRAA